MKLYHARFAQAQPGGSVVVHEDDFYLPDVTTVRRQLVNKGFYPINIWELKPSMFEWMDVRSRDWQLQLLRALRFQTVSTSAGTALLNIIEGEQTPARRLAFLPARTVLKGGGSFAEALKELKLMDAATMAIITAGERAGDLKGVIAHAIEHVEEKGKQYKAIMAALGWLSFDIINIIGAIWGAQFGFIPYLKKQGIKTTDMAAIEKFNRSIELVSWVNGTLIVVTTAIVVGGVFLAGSYWFNRHKPNHFASRLMMKTPLIAHYLRNVSIQDTSKLMTRLLRGKVPLADSIEIILESTVEPATRIYWTDCQKRVRSGIEPSRALGRWPMTKAECDQIATIQSVDQLSEVYDSIAEERHLMAKTDQRKIVIFGIMAMMVLFGATVLTMIYLLMIQNTGFLENLNQMRG
ncbi:MAG: type II secretion system F family protein [Alphaproteobacteria bacterium]|nr:type II secretion system F family protein [Alphaproteobacteria bacterium]